MSNGIYQPPKPNNEPVKTYIAGSIESNQLAHALEHLAEKVRQDIPLVIGGEEIRTGDTVEIRAPHDKNLILGHYHQANAEHVIMAIEAAKKAKVEWVKMPWQQRASIFLKAAELLRGGWRATINAATMLSQSKNVYQAEIDAVCELIDFWAFNVQYMSEIYADQPGSGPGCWNRVEYRPLEGFVFAITPFNFTSIAGNLSTAPAMMGNTVLWKPASSSVMSGFFLMRLLKEAGLPDGVINFLPGSGKQIGDVVLTHRDLAGVHFTGSTAVFNSMWETIGKNIANYRSYPRIVGETGGKDFLIAHADCDLPALVTALIRGAFEYQGQKCSALSRAYLPKSIWPIINEHLCRCAQELKLGDIRQFDTFMGAVIDEKSYEKIKKYIEYAKSAPDAEILSGGQCDDSKGFFVEPTIIKTTNPHFKTMEEEIFGPVLTCYVYDDQQLEQTLKLVDMTSPYALTGAIFATDRGVIKHMMDALENAAGNFYVNDKPTGAVVGQQPFGGSRGSGTNDKAGSKLNLLRWTSVRTIKETFEPPTDYRYPHMHLPTISQIR